MRFWMCKRAYQAIRPQEASYIRLCAELKRRVVVDRPFLWIEPAREVTSLRTTASPKFQAKTTGDGGKIVPVSGATGSQIEARVSCTGVKAAGAAAVRRHTLSEALARCPPGCC